MQLSKLVYEVVKNVKYLEDTGFTYEAFVRGEYDNDLDYKNSINNAFSPINEAIHRLSDRNKIKHKIELIGKANNNGIIDLGTLAYDINKIINVFSLLNGDYVHVEFREFGKDKLLVTSNSDNELYLEYIQDICHFSKDDIYFFTDNNNIIEKKDVDLKKDFGITETMCSYIIEYAAGRLLEPIAPELANMHITRSEQYFDDLEEQQTPFSQNKITTKYRIE